MDNRLTLHEQWALDAASYDKQKNIKTTYPQCESCAFFEKGNVLNCKKYVDERKPNDVLFARKECPAFEAADPVDYTVADETQNRLYGGILGFCVGDMLGVPVEFSLREDRDEDPVKELRAYGTYHQPFGSWSDDSSLMFCLIDAVCRGYSAEKLSENMIAYYKDGRFTPNGTVFDIGNSTRAAIENMMKGVPPEKCGGTAESDNGNGALMRILPLAFISKNKTEDELTALVAQVSSLTHAHPRSVLACIFYTVFAKKLFEGETKDSAYGFAAELVEKLCRNEYKTEARMFRGILSKTVISLNREQISSTGYVIDTLESVLWVLYHSDSYKEAVLNAVNLGGDTDTIAGLTGGLAGIEYGYEGIPQNWLQMIQNKAYIQKLIQEFESFIKAQ